MTIDWHRRFQGIVPEGFERIALDRCRTVIVQRGMEAYLCREDFPTPLSGSPEEAPRFGRDRMSRLRLGPAQTALVRRYRHGGLLRRLTGGFFLTWPPRPFRELALTIEARRRGIQTVEVVGARVERVFGPVYRGWLVTREIEADHFWDVLQNGAGRGEDRPALLRSVAECVSRMHRLGLFHADLNLKNVLVRREDRSIASYVIDLDRARLFSGRVPVRMARSNLRRLFRSARKLDPEGRHFTDGDREMFVRFYGEAGCQ